MICGVIGVLWSFLVTVVLAPERLPDIEVRLLCIERLRNFRKARRINFVVIVNNITLPLIDGGRGGANLLMDGISRK